MIIIRKTKEKNNSQYYKYLIFGLILSILSLLSPVKAKAEEDNQGDLGFTVQAVRPDTQIETNKTYFFVETQPDVSQRLKIKVKSTRKEPVTLQMYVTNGQTNNSGDIEYLDESKSVDASLKEPLTEIAQFVEPELVVSNFEEKIVTVNVTPPKEVYEGIKLGALVFKLIPEEEKQQAKAVASHYQYRIGLITSATGEEYEDPKSLTLKEAKFALSHGEKQVLGVIHNPEPKLAENMQVIGTVTKKNSKNVLKTKIVENARMAPNSTFNFGIDWGVDKVSPGEYTLKIEAKNDQEKWSWKKDFSMSKERAKKMNEETVNRVVLPKWVPVAVSISLVIILLIIGALVVRSAHWQRLIKERNKKRKNKRKKERSSKG